VTRVSRVIPCGLTSVRARTCSPCCFGSSPIVAFRLAEARLHHPVWSFRRPSHSALRRGWRRGYRLWQLVVLLGVRRSSLSAACRRWRPARLRCVGSARFRDSLRRLSRVCLPWGATLLRQCGGVWQLPRQVSALGDVEVCSLLRTRASSSWLFLRIAALASQQCLHCGSSASVRSSALVVGAEGMHVVRFTHSCGLRLPASVGAAMVVHGFRLRSGSCRDASCIGSARAVSRTQRESSGRFGDPCVPRHTCTRASARWWLTNRSPSGVLAPSEGGFGCFRAFRRRCARHVPRDADSRSHVLRSAWWSDRTL
jgi:hypothetical protein